MRKISDVRVLGKMSRTDTGEPPGKAKELKTEMVDRQSLNKRSSFFGVEGCHFGVYGLLFSLFFPPPFLFLRELEFHVEEKERAKCLQNLSPAYSCRRIH